MEPAQVVGKINGQKVWYDGICYYVMKKGMALVVDYKGCNN